MYGLGSRREVWAGPSEPKPSPYPLPHAPSSPLALEQRLGVSFGAQMQMAALTVSVPIPGGVLWECIFLTGKIFTSLRGTKGCVCVCICVYVYMCMCTYSIYTLTYTHM